jgi:hypothetical protein
MALLFCCVFVCARPPAFGLNGKAGHAFVSRPGIYQLIEVRNGRKSCWGVVIQLGELRFKKRITADQLTIREAKHGHDLRGIMLWRVSRGGKQLIIKFKKGAGDFGSGNAVEVRVDRAAFDSPVPSPNTRFEWSIPTDIS